MLGFLKRVLIYGYLFYIGYQALLSANAKDVKLYELVNKFESQFPQFEQLYTYLPQLRTFRVSKYPMAIMGFSALSTLLPTFGVFALASHAFYNYLVNPKVNNVLSSINRKMDVQNFLLSLDMELIILFVLYLGFVHQVVTNLFCCTRKAVAQIPVEQATSQKTKTNQRENKQNSKKKHL